MDLNIGFEFVVRAQCTMLSPAVQPPAAPEQSLFFQLNRTLTMSLFLCAFGGSGILHLCWHNHAALCSV